MSFDYWVELYKTDLLQLYNIYLETSKDSELEFKKYIPYPVFCKIIYEQSSKKISKYVAF